MEISKRRPLNEDRPMPNATPKDLKTALQASISHFNSGRLAEAAAMADQVLVNAPNNPDALHIAGLSRLQMGDPQGALPLLENATRVKKLDGGIANSLALAHLALGNVKLAAKTLEPLARKNKLSAAGLSTLGDCRLRQGDPIKAKACFEKALKLQPNLSAALVNLGEALKHAGDLPAAIEHYKSVTAAHPAIPSALRNLGLALLDAERFEDSIAPLQRYLTLNPNDVPSRMSLGSSYSKMGSFENALEAFDAALKVQPDNAEALNNRGVTLRTMDRTDEAEAMFKQALDLDPGMTSARGNLAHMLHETKGLDEALALLDQGIAMSPDNAKAHIARSHPLLIDGKLADGWIDQKWRFQIPPEFSGRRDHAYPVWDGSHLSDKTILVWGEQGVGDEILYSSMLPDLTSNAKHVVLECEARLAPLFARSFPQATVVTRTTPAAATINDIGVDVQIPIGDLIPHFRPEFESFPGGAAYLTCNDDQKAELVERYRSLNSGAPRVGVAWFSGRALDGWRKTIPLELWGPILSQPNASFVSLQYGDHAEEITEASTAFGCDIHVDPYIDSLKSMDAFAAQVATMDLVITNSNTTAHVAGALGIPVWIMVPRVGSGGALWYWFKDGTKSPWYKSMKLYRQTEWQNWSRVIDKVAADLTEFLTQK